VATHDLERFEGDFDTILRLRDGRLAGVDTVAAGGA
jgi:hypothetical protein